MLLAAAAPAQEPAPQSVQAMILKLMQETRLVMVVLPGPVADFKENSNPNTLQIVQLARSEDGPSRVSEDGEVIFLYRASQREQQALITRAFELRARRRLPEQPR